MNKAKLRKEGAEIEVYRRPDLYPEGTKMEPREEKELGLKLNRFSKIELMRI